MLRLKEMEIPLNGKSCSVLSRLTQLDWYDADKSHISGPGLRG